MSITSVSLGYSLQTRKKTGDHDFMETENKLNEIVNLFKSLGPKLFFRTLGSLVFSINHYYFLGRNLEAKINFPTLNMPSVEFSAIDENDLGLLETYAKSLGPDDRRELIGRLRFYESGFKNCYVIKNGDAIAYLQWIIYPKENSIIQDRYAKKFYPLGSNQVMIENAFTFPKHRGRGYLLFATGQLLETARSQGYTSAICYIRNDRIASLNEFFNMGFKIIRMIKEYKLLGMVWRTL
jgi:GNAT superfamily N-acetyltransferase